MAVRVPLEFAKPTMRLARPILDSDGKLIAGSGTLLGDRIVRLLRRMALQTVLVEESEELPAWGTIRPLQQQLMELEERFEREENESRLVALRQAIARHLTRRAEMLEHDPALAVQPEEAGERTADGMES